MSRCVITGCHIVIPAEGGKSLMGDLHDCISYWVFAGNTTGNMMREADWEWKTLEQSDKQLMIDGPYFEKRGIITAHKDNCYFNDAAANYLML